VCNAAHVVWRIAVAYQARQPSAKDQREVEATNEPGCEHHARLHIFEPVFRTNDVGGNLPHPMALCHACHDQVRRKGKLPTGDWIEERRRTGKAERIRVAPGT
jgi:hypothetical protein